MGRSSLGTLAARGNERAINHRELTGRPFRDWEPPVPSLPSVEISRALTVSRLRFPDRYKLSD